MVQPITHDAPSPAQRRQVCDVGVNREDRACQAEASGARKCQYFHAEYQTLPAYGSSRRAADNQGMRTPSFLRSKENRSAVIAAIRRLEQAANDYRIMRGRIAERTAMQDALRWGELMETRVTSDEAHVAAYRALYATAEYLAAAAVRCGITLPHLHLWLAHPDPNDGLQLARMDVRLLEQAVRDAEVGDEQPAAATTPPDGPQPPDLLWWRGKHFKVQPKVWRLLRHLWPQERRSAPVSEVLAAVWGPNPDRIPDAEGDALKSAIKKASHALHQVGSPLCVSRKNRYLTLS